MLAKAKEYADYIGFNTKNNLNTLYLIGGASALPTIASYMFRASHVLRHGANLIHPIFSTCVSPMNFIGGAIIGQLLYDDKTLNDMGSLKNEPYPITRFLAKSILGIERCAVFSLGYNLPAYLAGPSLYAFGPYVTLATCLATGFVTTGLAEKFIFAKTDNAIIGNLMEYADKGLRFIEDKAKAVADYVGLAA